MKTIDCDVTSSNKEKIKSTTARAAKNHPRNLCEPQTQRQWSVAGRRTAHIFRRNPLRGIGAVTGSTQTEGGERSESRLPANEFTFGGGKALHLSRNGGGKITGLWQSWNNLTDVTPFILMPKSFTIKDCKIFFVCKINSMIFLGWSSWGVVQILKDFYRADGGARTPVRPPSPGPASLHLHLRSSRPRQINKVPVQGWNPAGRGSGAAAPTPMLSFLVWCRVWVTEQSQKLLHIHDSRRRGGGRHTLAHRRTHVRPRAPTAC